MLLQQYRRTKEAAMVPGSMKNIDSGRVPVCLISRAYMLSLCLYQEKTHPKKPPSFFWGKKQHEQETKGRKEKVVFGKSNQKMRFFYLHTISTQEVPHLSLDAYCFLIMGKCKSVPFSDSKCCLTAKVKSRWHGENHLTCYPQDTKHIWRIKQQGVSQS